MLVSSKPSLLPESPGYPSASTFLGTAILKAHLYATFDGWLIGTSSFDCTLECGPLNLAKALGYEDARALYEMALRAALDDADALGKPEVCVRE
jgi:hypothetical protein